MTQRFTLPAFSLVVLVSLLLAGCEVSTEGSGGVDIKENVTDTTTLAAAPPAYEEIVRLGLTDTDREYLGSHDIRMNEQGQVAGQSSGLNNSGIFGSAWLYDGSHTIRLGLTDSELMESDGFPSNFNDIAALNERGQVLGISYENETSSLDDRASWLYDGASTRRLDFDGEGDIASHLNDKGQVAGTRWVNGRSTWVWLYDGGDIIRLGFYDDHHMPASGNVESRLAALNERGQVIGTSLGSLSNARSAWLYNGSITVRLGLTDSEHTHSGGAQSSGGLILNEQGHVAGESDRFGGGGGQSAWLYDGSSTIRVGFFDDDHTASDGQQNSRISALNEQGHVAGESDRINGDGSFIPWAGGSSAWLYDGDNTIRLGLTDSEHTSIDGSQSSSITALNGQGQVVGGSERFGHLNDAPSCLDCVDHSAWLYDGSSTTRLGFTDSAHTRNGGYQNSSIAALNERGQVAGTSTCFTDTPVRLFEVVCRTPWLYDSASDQLYDLTLSTCNNGFAYGAISYLGDDGLVLGSYTLFDEDGTDLGSRAFYFTIEEGLHDLGTLVNESGLALEEHGWKRLTSVKSSNSRRQILGDGELVEGGSAPFLLTPAR